MNNKYKHLTRQDREVIEQGLKDGLTFKAIAASLGKDPTTISKEVIRHLTVSKTSVTRINAQGQVVPPEPCPKLLRPPYVCHPCNHVHHKCSFDKHYYNARSAQQAYERLRSEAREGIPLNKARFYENDRVISRCVRQGQHLYHILQTQDLGISSSTLYRHLHKGYLSISPLDLPRAVKFKPRKQKKAPGIPKALKEGRTYADFLHHIQEHQLSSWVEMDTVIGRTGGKVIMTFTFTFCQFMFGLLLADKSAAEAASKILALKSLLAANGYPFGEIFPVILTDNGGEFSDVFAFEQAAGSPLPSRLFFCDPMRSSQKPRIEKNHTLLRDIVPKGESFDAFSQDTVNLIFSHVNSVCRKNLNGRSAYEMFSFTFGDELAQLLGITPIPPEQVIQSPLLRKREAFIRTLVPTQA